MCAAAFGQTDNVVVRWRGIAGVVTAPGVDNPVGAIHSGTQPWTAKGGGARLNLSNGDGSFNVEGLVLNGGIATGTTGTVNTVIGTFVCTNGTIETTVDTPAVAITPAGNAELSFRIVVPSGCNNPTFLIRVPGALRWIATGTAPVVSKPGY